MTLRRPIKAQRGEQPASTGAKRCVNCRRSGVFLTPQNICLACDAVVGDAAAFAARRVRRERPGRSRQLEIFPHAE